MSLSTKIACNHETEKSKSSSVFLTKEENDHFFQQSGFGQIINKEPGFLKQGIIDAVSTKDSVRSGRSKNANNFHSFYQKKAPVDSGIIMKQEEIEFNEESTENEMLSLAVQVTKGAPSDEDEKGFGKAVSISLHGETKPNFDFGKGTVKNLKYAPAKECADCQDEKCFAISGILVLVFRANPTVKLPGRSEYNHLSPCQIKRVEKWIRDVLAPHEQEHVKAYETYNGTVSKPFRLKVCKHQWESGKPIQKIHDKVELKRREAAEKKSDDLDPFHTNIDLHCEEEKK